MEKLKVKHDHKLTDILKVSIFAIFLMMPFLTYAPTALYYGVNEYATAQEKTEQQPIYYESNEVSSIDDLIVGNIYELNYNNATQTLQDNITLCENFIVIEGSYTGAGYQGNPQASMPYIQFSSNNFIYTYESIDDVTYTRFWSFVKLVFVYKQTNNNNFPFSLVTQTDYQLLKEYQEITYTMSISDSMYNNWQFMWETPMYSWTNNSILKTGLDNFTGVFGVNNQSYITNLITYELIIVTIYIVIDIVLTLFKWLTHMVGSKE